MPVNAGWRYIGKPLKRKEDLRVLLGETQFLDDISLPGMAHLGFYRSPFAHARLKSVDVSQLNGDGHVLQCVTGTELQEGVNPIPFISAPSGCLKPAIYPLATGKMRYVGEPIAAVVVADKYDLEDAIEKVNIEFDMLPPINSLEEAVKSPTRLYEELESNVAYHQSLEHGDAERAFRNAQVIVNERFEIGRQYGAAMETRGVIADYEKENDLLTVWSSTQWPHFLSKLLSETLNHPEGRLRVVAPDVGGGFGNKQDFYREEVVAALLAKRLVRPVKWVPARREDMSSTVHARSQVHRAEMALDQGGRVLGLRDSILADLGAYGPMSLGSPMITFAAMTGPYDIENLSLDMRCVVTSKVPTGAYRGFGQPEATFVLERLMDMAAEELKMDRAEIRRKNLVTRFPYKSATGRVLDSGDYVRMLDRGLELSGYASLKEQAREKDGKLLGVGLSFGFEGSGLGPSRLQDAVGARHKGYDSVTLRIMPEGKATILTGLSPHGQGLETTLSQVCADALGIEIEDVSIIRGDSLTAPYGFGTWGSRSAVLGAGAILRCVQKLVEKLIAIAAYNAHEKSEELEFGLGSVRRKGSSEPIFTLSALAAMAHDEKSLPAGLGTGLEETVTYEPPEITFSGGLHIVAAAIDPKTGEVKITKYVMIHDCGIMLNPLIVEGQLQGGLAQGIGGALLEEVIYNEEGQLLTSTFMDYLIPSALDIPYFELEHTITPSPYNSLGIKGMGESGVIGPAPAINNAICDALGGGVRLNRTPVSPSELWESIRALEAQK